MQMSIAQQLGLDLSTVGNFFMNARRRSQDKWADESNSAYNASNVSNGNPLMNAGQCGQSAGHHDNGGSAMSALSAMSMGLLTGGTAVPNAIIRHDHHDQQMMSMYAANAASVIANNNNSATDLMLNVDNVGNGQHSQSSNCSSIGSSSDLGSPCSSIGNCISRLGDDHQPSLYAGQQRVSSVSSSGQATSVVRLGVVNTNGSSGNCA